jgi:hypothetical protein
MNFNISKCKILGVARTHTVFDREYTLGGESLNIVESEKDLGVWLHSNLGWNDHVDDIAAKAQKMLGLLYRSTR